MTATTSTSALAAPGASGSIGITDAYINSGSSTFDGTHAVVFPNARLPIYAGAVNAAQPGVYLTPTPDFVGTWSLQRHISGMQAAPLTDVGQAQRQQLFLRGDQTFLFFAGPGPLAQVTSMDSLMLTVVGYQAGSLTLSVVQ